MIGTNNVVETRECPSCLGTFDITKGELNFFDRHGLNLPKRCRPCRERRREQSDQASPAYIPLERKQPVRPR